MLLHTFRFSLQNAVYFIMLTFFGSCIIHILHRGCVKILNVKLGCQKVKYIAEVKVKFFVTCENIRGKTHNEHS